MDEKQLQFLYDNYGSGKGFKDINEFRDLLSNPGSRKVFFDASNKDLGFKDIGDFENTLGVNQKPIPVDAKAFNPLGDQPKAPKQVQEEYTVSGKLPSIQDFQNSIPKYAQGNQAASTEVVKPFQPNSAEGFINHNAEKEAQNTKLKGQAVENTAKKILQNRGEKIDFEKPLNVFQFAQLTAEKKKLEQALASGDVTYTQDKDGNPGLNRTVGFWESLSKGWNEAVDGNKFAKEFMDASTEQKLEMLKAKQAENKHPEFVGESQSDAGSVGHLAGGAAPYLAKGVAGYATGTALAAAAPETAGISLAALPKVMSFLFTTDDMMNQGGLNEVVRSFDAIKKENPQMSDLEIMRDAEQRATIGKVGGVLTNALMMGTSIKAPLSEGEKLVIKDAIAKTAASAVHMGATTAAVEGGLQAEGNLEGVKATPSDITKAMANSFVDNGTLAGSLHILTGAVTGAFKLPKVLQSAIKYSLKDADPKVLTETLLMNEHEGTVPPGTTQKVLSEIKGYKEANNKVMDGLPPKVEASVTGLVEAKNKLIEEQKTKDSAIKPVYDEKIAAIDNQIQKTLETGRPYDHEVDEMSGDKYRAKLEEISKPIELNPEAESSPKENLPEEPSNELPSETVHKENIHNKFRKEFEGNRVPKEQVDGAIALMEARAKSWASEKNGRTSDEWYQRIADIKNGEFTDGTQRQFQMIGENAKLEGDVKDRLETAKSMEASGNESKDIFLKTGWEKGSDGKWRHDIQPISINYDKIVHGNIQKLKDILSGDVLKAYPQIAEEKIQFSGGPNFGGSYNPKTHEISITYPEIRNDLGNIDRLKTSENFKNKERIEGILTHEIQHIIQEIEGFDKGGNTGEPDISSSKSFESKSDREARISKYRSIPGEIDARNAQVRAKMTDQEKAATPISETADIKLQQGKEGLAHGAVETLADGRKIIHALDAPDFSTMVHEIAHVFETDLTESEKFAVKNFGGSESFARGFEKYLRDGDAPTLELKNVFIKFQQWLTDIYKTLKGSPIEKRVTSEIKQIFDRLLTEQKSENKPIPEETTLTPEESKVSEKIPEDLANHVAEGKDITVETLEKHKDEIVNDKDAPYTKEDYETVKNYLDETGRRAEEPAANEQQGISDAEAKATPDKSQEVQTNTTAAPEEHTNGEVGGQGLTSIKNAVVDAEREARGEEQFIKPDMRGYEKIVLPEAKEAVDKGEVNHNSLAAELAKNPRPISDTEVGILTYGRKLLQNEEKSLMDQIETAQKDGDVEKEATLRAQLDTNESNLINNDIASEKSGTATARGLAARRMVIAEDYSLGRMLQRVRINNDGKVPEEARKQIEALSKQLEEAQKKLDSYDENNSKKAAEESVKNIKKDIEKEVKKTIPVLRAGKLPKSATVVDKQKVSDFFDKLKIKTNGETYVSIIPVTPEMWNGFVEVVKKGVLKGIDIAEAIKEGVEYLKDKGLSEKEIKEAETTFKVQAGLEKESKISKAYADIKTKLEDKTLENRLAGITPELTKLAKEYISQGVDKMDDIVDIIHDKIKDEFDDLTKREVRDAISGYGKTLELSKDEVEKQLRELKSQARLISGLEDVEEGKAPLRSGLQRDEQSDEVRSLRKQLSANMRKAGIEVSPRDITKQFKTALDGVKRRLENQIADMNLAIEKGEKMPGKKGIEYDEAAKVLRDQRDKVREVYDNIFKKDKEKPTRSELLARAKDNIKNRIAAIREQILSKERVKNDTGKFTPDQEYQRLKDEESTLKNLLDEYLPKEKPYADAIAEKKTEERLISDIEKLNKQINDGEREIKDKKGTITNDAIEKLRTIRDIKKELLDEISPKEKTPISDEQRIEMAKKALERSIKEYERKIDEQDFKPKDKRTISSPELEAMRAARDKIRESYNSLIPDEVIYKAKLDKYGKYLEKRQKDLQAKIDSGDFADKPKKEPLVLTNELISKKAEVAKVKRQLDKLVADYKYKNRTKFEKKLEFIGRFRRGLLLSSVVTLGKLTSAAIQRPLNNLAEGVVGSLLHYPLKGISDKAPTEGGGINLNSDVKAISEMWSKNTLKDTWEVAKNGHGELADMMGKNQEHYRGILDLAGQIHQALKNPVKRYAFKRAMMKRQAFAAKHGENIYDPMVQSKLAVESYADANRAIFMQDNMISSAYSQALGRWSAESNKGKLAATIARFFLPIVKVPTNFVAETSSYYIGALKGAAMLTKGVQSLKPEEADYVMRNFKKQGVGVAVFLIGYFGAANVGGFYTGKREEDDLQAGDVKMFGMKIPHWATHTPLWTILHAGATFRRIKDSYVDQTEMSDNGDETPKPYVGDALKTTFKSTIDGIPFVQTPVRMYDAFKSTGNVSATAGATVKSLFLPPDLQKIAEGFDVDDKGETRKVDQNSFWKQLQEGMPGLRNKMETKE